MRLLTPPMPWQARHSLQNVGLMKEPWTMSVARACKLNSELLKFLIKPELRPKDTTLRLLLGLISRGAVPHPTPGVRRESLLHNFMSYTWLSPRPAQPREGRKGGLMDLLPKSELEGVEIQMRNLQDPAVTREMGTACNPVPTQDPLVPTSAEGHSLVMQTQSPSQARHRMCWTMTMPVN